MKTCSRCRERKPLAAFSPAKHTRDLRRSECRGCRSKSTATPEAKAAYYRKNRSKWAAQWATAHRRQRFGLTPAQYDEMLEDQGGVCASCGEPETLTIRGKLCALAVDHDHESGRVRGLLCHHCNLALGHLMDDVGRIQRLLRYLKGA